MSKNKTSNPQNAVVYEGGFTRLQLGAAISPRTQELIILPTEKCNFRCTYCYEDFSIGKMSMAVQRAIELLIDKRVRDLSRLSLSWFGGEPLLARDIVLRIARYAKRACDSFGVAFEGGLTTNGYLLDSNLLTDLIECNQNFFQITLDGWSAGHDSHRRRADGKGTFEKIWSNILAMHARSEKFEVVIRVHVRRDNLASVNELLANYRDALGHDHRFRVDFQHLRDLGGEGGKSITDPISVEEATLLEKSFRRILLAKAESDREAEPSNLSDLDDAEVGQIRGESSGSRRQAEQDSNAPYICYAARPNSILIRADGRIGKCTVAFSDPRNELGYIADDGTLQLNTEKLRPWMRGLKSLSNRETACPLDGMPDFDLKAPESTSRRIIPIST